MSHLYLDASAMVKRYSPETGSAWVKALTDPPAGHTIILSEITLGGRSRPRRQAPRARRYYPEGARRCARPISEPL